LSRASVEADLTEETLQHELVLSDLGHGWVNDGLPRRAASADSLRLDERFEFGDAVGYAARLLEDRDLARIELERVLVRAARGDVVDDRPPERAAGLPESRRSALRHLY